MMGVWVLGGGAAAAAAACNLTKVSEEMTLNLSADMVLCAGLATNSIA